MKSPIAGFLFSLLSLNALAQKTDTKYYETRIYYCYPGKLDALIERFTNHTTRIFEKHGMENIGYWLPVNNEKNALYYILAYPSKEARDSSWKAFGADPEWRTVAAKSEENGKIVEKVVSIFMNRADLKPDIAPLKTSKNRIFEMRTYTCAPGKLPELLNRFRNHTFKGFKKYGYQNIGYWTTVEKDGGQAKLVYLLAFSDEETAKKKWEAFRADADWVKAKADSEKDGKLVENVESVFMKPLSFSKIK
jgi:hypothetical protein